MDDMVRIEQGTDAWRAMRLGKVTASKIADATARTESGWSASRANYMADLISERLTGASRDGFTNAAMQWGTDMEPEARRVYEFMHDVDVDQVAFVDHPSIPNSGASPDGLVGTDGLIEIKCPNTATHIKTLLGAEIDGKYIKQMQWQMTCTGRKWCDFVSYDPRMPERMQMHIRRVHYDATMVLSMEEEISEFLAELSAKVNELRRRFGEDV